MRSQDSTLINSWVEVFACMVMHFINTSFWIQFCTSNLAVNYKFIYLSNYFEALGEAKNYVFFSFFFWTGGVTLSNPTQDGSFRDCSRMGGGKELTSAFLHQKSANFSLSRNTVMHCITAFWYIIFTSFNFFESLKLLQF